MPLRLQSAMEFLLTYGWALLLIALALSAIIATGLLNSASYVSTQCLLPAGLSCTVVQLATNGLITINLRQTTPSQINITAIACNSTSTFPSSILQSYPPAGKASLHSGANATLSVRCYSGSSHLSAQVGSAFAGYLVVYYNETVTGFPHLASGRAFAKVSSVGS